jgi:aminoglycoside phosphotransferase (APT) family kinase protein
MQSFNDQPAEVRSGEELDTVRLEAYLRQHLTEDGPLEVRQFPSGHSNLTYSITLGARKLVLRKPPFGSKVKSAHDMGREFKVLSRLHVAYAPAPKVLFFCDDPEVLGSPFYLMEPIEGLILRNRIPSSLDFSPPRAHVLSELFLDNLVALHAVDYVGTGLAALGKPEGYLERQVHGWTERYFQSKTHEYSQVEKITAWMQANLPSSSTVALIHNDYKYDNVVLDPDDLTIRGVLDWEMCTLGDPLADLGTTLAYWTEAGEFGDPMHPDSAPTAQPGSLTRDELVARYAEKTGADVAHIAFYLVLARFKLAVIVQQIYFRFYQGLTQDQRFASMPQTIAVLLKSALACAETQRI